jgi:hypothetical protein
MLDTIATLAHSDRRARSQCNWISSEENDQPAVKFIVYLAPNQRAIILPDVQKRSLGTADFMS